MRVRTRRSIALMLLAIAFAGSAQAAVQEIRVTFVPGSSNPMVNRFESKTPQAGVCASYRAVGCQALGAA